MRNSYIILLFTLFRTAHGQDSTALKAKQAIQLEFGGTGQGVSLNYERIFSQTPSWRYGARVGVGTISFSQIRPTVLGELFALKGKEGNFLELGVGASYLFPITSTYTSDGTLVTFRGTDYLWLVPRIGYRRQNPRGDVFRIGWTPPVVLQAGKATFRPLVIGLSIGRSF